MIHLQIPILYGQNKETSSSREKEQEGIFVNMVNLPNMLLLLPPLFLIASSLPRSLCQPSRSLSLYLDFTDSDSFTVLMF